MRNDSIGNMEFDGYNSSFDSEAEDLEMRMYTELYFEPNPDYVPLPSSNDRNSIAQSSCFSQSNSPVCDGNNSTVWSPGHKSTRPESYVNGLLSNNNVVTKKLSNPVATNDEQTQVTANVKERRRENLHSQVESGSKRSTQARLLSNSCSMVLDQLDCSNSPIEKENNHCDYDAPIKVSNLMQSDKSKASQPVPCNKKPSPASRGSLQMKQMNELIVIDDSSSDSNNRESVSSRRPKNLPENNNIQVPIVKHRLKNKSEREHLNVSAPFTHEAHSPSIGKKGTLMDVIMKLKSKSKPTVKNGKNERPCTRKKIDRKKGSRSLTEFTADLSDESDSEATGLDHNGTLLTNLSINGSASLRNSAMERVYGITPGEDKQEEDITEPSKKRHKKTRTHWPTDFTTDKSLRNRVPPLPHWTPHMTAFYETDFSDEFDLEDIQKRMPSSVIEWDLEEDDLPYSVLRRKKDDHRGTPRQRQRYFRGNERCERCRSYDHSLAECDRLEHCHLCGNTGHSSKESCPSNTCLRCGEGVHTFCQKATVWTKCDLCNRKGHPQDLCPDVWRRFCYTTSGSTPVAPSNNPSSSVAPDRLSCFSCGRGGHLGPDCQHRVPNYVVLSYDVLSFDSPTENLLGKTILRSVEPPAWDAEEEVQVCSQYGEDVTVHTPSRASVLLRAGSAGLVIGKGGVVINTLKRVSGCTLSVTSNNRGQDELWVSGANIDPVIRAVLFFLLRVTTDLDGLDVYAAELEAATGHGLYDKAYRREIARLRAEYSRHKLQDKQDRQAADKKNVKKAKRALKREAINEVVARMTNGNGMSQDFVADYSDVVCVSDSDESGDDSDVQVIDKTERVTSSRRNLANQSKASDSCTTPSAKKNTSKRLADEIKRSAKKLKGANGNIDTESAESSDAWVDSKSEFIDRILSKRKVKNNKSMNGQLTDSENSDGGSDSSVLDSAMEDYAANCFTSSGSDTDITLGDSDGDSTDESDDSGEDSPGDDEESEPDSDGEGQYNLVLSDRMLAALAHKKLARKKTLVQMLPEGRLSLMATIKGKLAELYNLHVDVRSTLEQLKKDCAEQNRTRSASSLWSLQEGVKLLATYVLGTKRLGPGQALVKSLMRTLASLEARKEARVATPEREEIASTLQGLFEVDESSLATITSYAVTLVNGKGRRGSRVGRAGEPILESTPKPQQGRSRLTRVRATPTNSRRYSSFSEDRRLNSTKNKNKNNSMIDRLRYPSTFTSFDEIEQFNTLDFLRRKKIGTFTKTPRVKKLNSSRERKLKSTNKSFDGRLDFPSPFGGGPQATRRSSSKSPRTFKSKSPKRFTAKSPNTSGKPARRNTSKSPRTKRNNTADGRAKPRGKGSKSLRTKSKSPRRRK